VVVEAAIRSGALNTATWASRLSRALMGVPGPVTSAPSEGVHELMRSGAATVVTRGEDVLELVAPVGECFAPVRRAPELPRDRLSSRDLQVLEAVPKVTPAAAASISRMSGIGVKDVVAALQRLLAGGFVETSRAGWRLVSD
jgi:DNA processing protein